MAFLNSFPTAFLFLIGMSMLEFTSAKSIYPHPLSKHSFTEVSKCAGIYDMNIYAEMDQICLNCFNIYREPEVYRVCRKDCFTSEYFQACLSVLQMTDQKDKMTDNLAVIHRQLESQKKK